MDGVQRALTAEHPLGALALGVLIVGASWLWLRYAEQYSRWLLRAVGARYPAVAERRWYRVFHIYFGAAFLFLAGVGTIIAAAVNLAR